ncbi:MAG TPA: hypothetical protein VMW38_25420 [Terriglobia bacterium]|nr:hypothetical protein [Terriglobia bacterium]
MQVVMLVVAICVMALAEGTPTVTEAKDKRILDGFLLQAGKVAEILNPERCREAAKDDAEETEANLWQVLPYLRMPLAAYELTHNAKYLAVFVEAFENMRGAMTKGPDGYLGWYGKIDPDYADPANPGVRLDAIISSFGVTEALCDFLNLVSEDPALSRTYTKQCAEYLDLAENQLVKKHDVRGDYVELGKGGAIYRMPSQGLKQDYCARLTMPHNKHDIIMRAYLALYRVTGKDEYMRRAIRLGVRYKHCLTLKDGHYEWYYWDPAGEWDIKPLKPAEWKHWMGPEHRGGYYSLSLSQAVLLYQYGLVFDKTDMDRFVKTQLKMCWNGDFAHPVWSRVDGTRPAEYTQGEYISAALAPFNERVAQFVYGGERQEWLAGHAGDAWQAAQAGDWLREKLLDYPAAKDDAQPYSTYGQRFLAKKENRDFLASLAFEVTASGYQPPHTPAEMKNMPKEPRSQRHLSAE